MHGIQFKLGVYTYLVSVQNWFAFRAHWPNFGPLVATKLLKMVVSDHYLEKYSHNPIQTWCVHVLDDCSELIDFWATLAKFWPSCGQKNDRKWWFPTVIWKSTIMWNNDYSINFKHGVHTGWGLHKWSHFFTHRPNLALLVATSVFPYLWLGLGWGRTSSDALVFFKELSKCCVAVMVNSTSCF